MPKTHQKVWRFVEYRDRFGTECDGVPQFIRWYLNGWDPAGGEVIRALGELKKLSSGDYIWAQGAIVELLSICTNTKPVYQGYLLNSRKQPATCQEIGTMLQVDGRKALATLNRFEKAGFLEQVQISAEFFDPKPDSRLPQSRRKVAKAKKGKVSQGRRNPACWHQKRGSPFKGKAEGKGKEKIKPTLLRSGDEVDRKAQAQRIRDQIEGMQTGGCLTVRQSDIPTKTDGGGFDALQLQGGPHVDSVAPVGQILKLHTNWGRLDPLAQELAKQTMRAASYRPSDALDRAQQLGALGSAWHKIVTTQGPAGIEYVKGHVFAKALESHTKRNPMGWLQTVVQNKGRDAARKYLGHKQTSASAAG